MHYRDKVTEEH